MRSHWLRDIQEMSTPTHKTANSKKVSQKNSHDMRRPLGRSTSLGPGQTVRPAHKQPAGLIDNNEAQWPQHHLPNAPAGLRINSIPHTIEPIPTSVDQAHRQSLFIANLIARESEKPQIETEVVVGKDTLNPKARLIAESTLQRLDRLKQFFSTTT